MTKHKLDARVEEILQHHGVKGMKWGVRKATNKTSSVESEGSGGGGVDDETIDDPEDLIEAIKKKLGDVSDAIKKKGKSILASIFGESKTTYKIAKPNEKLTQQFREAMKKSNLSDRDIKAINKAKQNQKIRGERAKSSNKQTDAILDKYKKQGYKKHEKSKKTLAERGYTFRTESKK